jgi:alanyl-tRNA synthetase
MTERLYYTDSYLARFDAVVTDAFPLAGRPAVVLDRTAFYPASGGQPHDVGRLADTPVLEVVDLEDGRVAHVLESQVEAGSAVHGEIDWRRRFDHMQQHSGQHVLSAAFDRVSGLRTESFHLGAETSTIDLARPVAPDVAASAEDEANRIVWEDRPVSVRFVTPEQAADLPLRKEPVRTGLLRLVDMGGFDLSACGGTHVARTGEIGIIAITAWERFKGGTRVEFVCGGRALRRLRVQRDVLAACVRRLSVLPEELPAGIERLQDEVKQRTHAARTAQSRLLTHEAAALAARARSASGRAIVAERVTGLDATALKALAAAVVERPGLAVCLLGGDGSALVVVARSSDVALDAGAVVRELTTRFGGKGGGRAELAQAGGLGASAGEILDAASRLLVSA